MAQEEKDHRKISPEKKILMLVKYPDKLKLEKKRGRPKRRWKDCTKDNMVAMGLTVEDAHDRALWKTKIHTGDPVYMEIKPERRSLH